MIGDVAAAAVVVMEVEETAVRQEEDHAQDPELLNEEGEDHHPEASQEKELVVLRKEDQNLRNEKSPLITDLHLLTVARVRDQRPMMHRKKDLDPDQEVDLDQDHEMMTTKIDEISCVPQVTIYLVAFNRHITADHFA